MNDEVTEMLERKRRETLAYKRSFFVRMVSDPKIYNPTIAKTLLSARRHLTDSASGEKQQSLSSSAGRGSSWISWPLAFLFQGEDSSDVPIR